jgi:hypothetical protein
MNLENIVEGHGEVLLKGEIDETLDSAIGYLDCIQDKVKAKLATRTSKERLLNEISLESCGYSPIALDGLVKQLHRSNLQRVFQTLTAKTKEKEKKMSHRASSPSIKGTMRSGPEPL